MKCAIKTVTRKKMEYHKTVKQIIDLLQDNNFWFETFEHEPVRTSEEAAKIRPEYTLHQGAKTIILRIKKTEKERFFAMVVIPGDCRFDKKKVMKVFAARDIRFATEVEVKEITKGVEPGGVPPFGNLFGLKVVVDHSVLENEKIVFNAGDKRFTVAMRSMDFERIVKPEVVEII